MIVPPSSPIPSETIEMELNTISIIEVILNQLEGKAYDPSTNTYLQVGERIVNEKGEKKIATVLAAYLSRDKILSILSLDEIKEMTEEVAQSVAVLLSLNYREFGIAKTDLSIVQGIIEHTVYVNLKRALEGRTLDHIGNVVKISERETKEGGARLAMPNFGMTKEEDQ